MTNPNPFEAFAARHGFTMTAESVPFRPGASGDQWQDSALHFAAEIKTGDGRTIWRGFYSVGSAFPMQWAKEKRNPARLAPSEFLALRKLPAVPVRETLDAAALRELVRERYKRAAPLRLADVLESLSLDWGSVTRAESFEDWASDFGMDTDSRKAESMFRECEAGARTARAVMGPAVFAEFLEIEPE